MGINELVKNSLQPLNVPVEFQTYEGEDDPYITFFEYLDQGEMFSDDKENNTGYYIQIDLWSKWNLEELKKDTIKLLKANGFVKRTIHDAPYEPDTEIFHKVLRFFFIEENKEDE